MNLSKLAKKKKKNKKKKTNKNKKQTRNNNNNKKLASVCFESSGTAVYLRVGKGHQQHTPDVTADSQIIMRCERRVLGMCSWSSSWSRDIHHMKFGLTDDINYSYYMHAAKDTHARTKLLSKDG